MTQIAQAHLQSIFFVFKKRVDNAIMASKPKGK